MTLALNLYTQGVSPKIDFSDLNSVIDVVESCTKIPVHQRAPYGGSLVCAAFSGSHQDAIKKGFQNRQRLGLSSEDPWLGMPYLPLDPQDIGRNYEAIIRVNSQSGKGGSAFILHSKLQLDLPRSLQIAFSSIVQRRAEELGRELLATEITDLFETTYFLHENPRFGLVDYSITPDRSHSPMPSAPGRTQDTKSFIRIFEGVILLDGQEFKLRGRGNGPISSMAAALKDVGIDLDVHDYKEHAIGEGKSVKAASYIECKPAGSKQTVWGVGIHEDVVQSSLLALLSAASNVSLKSSWVVKERDSGKDSTANDETLQFIVHYEPARQPYPEAQHSRCSSRYTQFHLCLRGKSKRCVKKRMKARCGKKKVLLYL